jgi:hypothetical protein
MAFQDVNKQGAFAKITELEVGGSITGYYLGAKPSSQYEGKFQIMLKIGEDTVTIPAVGNLHYAVQDNKLKDGQLTRITREEDKKGKGGKKSTQVRIEQDKEDVIEVAPTLPAGKTFMQQSASSRGVGEKLAAMKA